MIVRVMVFALAAFAWTAQAYADPIAVQAAGKTVNLLLPDKTCAYDRAQKYDAGILDAMERANPKSQLLLAFIDCDNLKIARGATRIAYKPGYYGQILSDIAGQAVSGNYTREQYVKAIGDNYGAGAPEKALESGEQKLQALINDTSNAAGVTTIGVIKRDKDFFQVAMLGTQVTPSGTKKIMNIVTVTKLDVPVSIYFGYPVSPGMALVDLSNRAELYARQLIDANPEPSAIFAHGFDKWSALVGAAAGIVIGLLLARLFRSR